MNDPEEPFRELAGPQPSLIRRLGESVRGAVPVVRTVARGASRLAMLAVAGGVLIWIATARAVDPGPGRLGRLVLAALLLAIPPLILLLVSFSLRQLAGLPDRLAALPDEARSQAGEIGRLAQEARRVRERGWFRSAIAVFRLWRSTSEARGLLEGAVPVAFLLSPWTWIAGPLAIGAAILEILGGAVALLWLVLG